jgi:hypothetical protein
MGARSGTAGDALAAKEKQEMSSYISKSQACRKNATYFKLEKPRFLFLKGSGGSSTAPAGASAVPAGTSTDDPVTGGSVSASRVDSVATPATRRDGGATGSHLSEVAHSPSLSSSYEDEFTNTGEGERPYCSRSRYSSLY